MSKKAAAASSKHHTVGGNDLAFSIYDSLVHQKLKVALGLEEAQYFVGGAPVDQETAPPSSRPYRQAPLSALQVTK